MLIKQIIIRKRAQEIEKKSPYIFLFHCNGLTSLQWRQLKNILCTFQGRTLFQPSCRGKLPYKKKQGGLLHSLLLAQAPLVSCT